MDVQAIQRLNATFRVGTKEVLSLLISGVAMASVARCFAAQDSLAAARVLSFTSTAGMVLFCLPVVAYLCMMALTTHHDSVYWQGSHAYAWWWLLMARFGVFACDILLQLCESQSTTLHAFVWLRYFIAGMWFGVGGWITSFAYLAWTLSSTSMAIAAIYELLSISRCLFDLKCIGIATEIYFGAMVVVLALDNWREACRALFGVGACLCGFLMVLSTQQHAVLRHLQSHFSGLTRDHFQTMIQALHEDTAYLAAAIFAVHAAGRLMENLLSPPARRS